MIKIIEPILSAQYLYIVISTLIVFIFSLELRPCMGNVWCRMGDDGKKHFCLGGIFAIFQAPFKMLCFWYPKHWDINPYAVLTLVTSLYLTYFNCKLNIY